MFPAPLPRRPDPQADSYRVLPQAERIEHHAAMLYKELIARGVVDIIDGRTPRVTLQVPLHRTRLIPDKRLAEQAAKAPASGQQLTEKSGKLPREDSLPKLEVRKQSGEHAARPAQ